MSTKKKRPKKDMVPTSLRIEREVLDAVDTYGDEIERSRNWLVNKLLRQSLSEINKL